MIKKTSQPRRKDTLPLPNRKTALATALCAAAVSQLGPAQVPPATILQVDVENLVQYVDDVGDPSKFATEPNFTTARDPRNFAQAVYLGDIVAVNGQSAKGTFSRVSTLLATTPSPSAGQAIADTTRGRVVADYFEILKSDGSPIGTIASNGLGEGAAPLGTSLSVTSGTFVIVGGTGAFFGVRGQAGQAMPMTAQRIPSRHASIMEDPANRRRNGGGKVLFVLQMIPTIAPQIAITAGGPAVTHSSDFTLVAASKPAAAGEILSLFATGLGPTVPAVDPGQPFPSNPPAAVNSPVDVKVNGKAAEVLAAVGFPGAVDGYQVNFRVPADAAKGAATIQVSAAWITGPPVNVPIQ